MDFTIKLSVTILIFLFTWLFQEENQSWDLQRTVLKNAANVAAHDASLQIDDDAKSRGFIVFDELAARSVFRDSLQRNLHLDASLAPISGSPVLSDVRVLLFDLLDDSNSTFPLFYEDHSLGFSQWIFGPAVVVVVEIDHPRFIHSSFSHSPVRVPVVAEYKENMVF